MLLKGASALHKAPPKTWTDLCLQCLPELHCTTARLCSGTNFTRGKGTFMGLTRSSSGCTGNWRAPLSWLAEHCKLCFIFWEVSWSDKSPAGHFFSAHPVLRCCCLGQSLEILWESKSLKAFWQQDVIICPSAECIGWPPPGSFQK